MCGGSGAETSMIPPRGCGTAMRRAKRCSFCWMPPGNFPVLDVEVFRIADDGVADMRHVGAQLMGASRHRLERQPGEPLRRRLHHRVIGDRVHGVLVAVPGDAHERVFLALLLGEIGRHPALARLGHAGDQRPVDLARRARAEGLGKRRSGKARLRHQQAAGGVLVEPMDQPRALSIGAGPAQGAEHAVNVTRGAGAALHGEAHGLVEHHDVVVLVERDRFQEGAVLLRAGRVIARRRRFQLERRDAHRLAGREPRFRLGALAVHAHLAFADDALDVAERQARKTGLEEAVDAHVVFVGGDGDGLHGGRQSRYRLRLLLRRARRRRQPGPALADLRTLMPISGKPAIGRRRPRATALRGAAFGARRLGMPVRRRWFAAVLVAGTGLGLAGARTGTATAALLMARAGRLLAAARLARAVSSAAHDAFVSLSLIGRPAIRPRRRFSHGFPPGSRISRMAAPPTG